MRFAREVLGVKLWRGQKEILRAIAKNPRTAIRSGHKCGKTTALAIAALWWWCTKRRARVILTAPSGRQVDEVLWGEIRRLYKDAAKRGVPLGGTLHIKAASGLVADDGRQIIGFATDEPERMAGFSGPNMLFLVDEASGVDRTIFEAIEGNRAGNATIVIISNPTQTSGVFWDAFTAERSHWFTVHISSWDCAREAPQEIGPETGLATLGWCQERLDEWGEEDARYQVRVLGNFPTEAEDTLIGTALVEASAKRWKPSTDEEGVLQFGVDVARFGRDRTCIVRSRGNWCSKGITLVRKDNVEVAGRVLLEIRTHRQHGEPVRVLVDVTNQGGVADCLRAAIADDDDGSLEGVEIVDVQYASTPDDRAYERLRDEIWFCLKDWIKKGGAIPNDRELHADLTAPRYRENAKGRLKVESKDDLKKRIGRSTDLGDATGLAVFKNGNGAITQIVLSDEYSGARSEW